MNQTNSMAATVALSGLMSLTICGVHAMQSSGQAQLTSQEPRVATGVERGVAFLTLRFADGREGIRIACPADGAPEITIGDPDSKASMVLTGGQSPSLIIRDSQGGKALVADIVFPRAPRLALLDEHGMESVQVIQQAGQSALEIRAPDGTPAIALSGAAPEGLRASLIFYGQDSAASLICASPDGDEAHISVRASDGTLESLESR